MDDEQRAEALAIIDGLSGVAEDKREPSLKQVHDLVQTDQDGTGRHFVKADGPRVSPTDNVLGKLRSMIEADQIRDADQILHSILHAQQFRKNGPRG